MPRDDHDPADPAEVPPAWPSALTADVFARAVRPLRPADADPAAVAAEAASLAAVAADLARRFDPRDLAEELLVAQMIWTHARVTFLTRQAGRQTDHRWFAAYSAELTRASHLYRRQMLALSDYRRPRRTPAATSFTTIRQANIAAQQLVQALPEPAATVPHPGAADALPVPRPLRPKRPYHLTPAGLAALRAAARATQPWTHSTGPRTPQGKAITRHNGLKHGLRAAANPDAPAYAAHAQRVRRAATAKPKATDPGPVIA